MGRARIGQGARRPAGADRCECRARPRWSSGLGPGWSRDETLTGWIDPTGRMRRLSGHAEGGEDQGDGDADPEPHPSSSTGERLRIEGPLRAMR
jgi:hypothetical protein